MLGCSDDQLTNCIVNETMLSFFSLLMMARNLLCDACGYFLGYNLVTEYVGMNINQKHSVESNLEHEQDSFHFFTANTNMSREEKISIS
jgi:hypothetical protein